MISFDNKIDLAGKVVRKSKVQDSNGRKIIRLKMEVPSIGTSPQTIKFCNDTTVDFIEEYIKINDYVATTATMCGYFNNGNQYKFALLADNIYSNRNLELEDNNVHLLGRVGGKIKTFNTKNGNVACSFYLYVKDKFSKNSDDYVFKINVFNKQVDTIIQNNVEKGTLLDIKGYLKSAEFNKQPSKSNFYEINANFVKIAQKKKENNKQNTNYSNQNNGISRGRTRYDESSDLIYEQSEFNVTESEFNTDLPF